MLSTAVNGLRRIAGRAVGANAALARAPAALPQPACATDEGFEPLLSMPMLGGLAGGVPAVVWATSTGVEFLCSSAGISVAMLGAPAIVTLATAVGAAIGVNFEQRAAALTAGARANSTNDARFKLMALLVMGTLWASDRVQIGTRVEVDAAPRP